MPKKMDRFLGAGIFLFGLFCYFWVIPNYVDQPQLVLDELPSDLYPKISVGAITILGFVLFLQSILSRQSGPKGKMPSENKKRAVLIIAVLIAFLFAIDLVGYYIATALFLIFMILFLGETRIWAVSLSVIIFLICNYFFFEKGLNLTLPRGLIMRLFS